MTCHSHTTSSSSTIPSRAHHASWFFEVYLRYDSLQQGLGKISNVCQLQCAKSPNSLQPPDRHTSCSFDATTASCTHIMPCMRVCTRTFTIKIPRLHVPPTPFEFPFSALKLRNLLLIFVGTTHPKLKASFPLFILLALDP
jgi:hypothetical protein